MAGKRTVFLEQDPHTIGADEGDEYYCGVCKLHITRCKCASFKPSSPDRTRAERDAYWRRVYTVDDENRA